MNVNCFSKAVTYFIEGQSYNSIVNDRTYLITAASSVVFFHIS